MLNIAEEKDLASIVETAVLKHGAQADAFIPILLEINHEYGYIPGQAIKLARKLLNDMPGKSPDEHLMVSEGQLYGLASFYHMLHTEKTGRHVVQFCESAPCHVQGGRELWKSLQLTLGLKAGETDAAGRFTLKTVSCLGVCGVGPVVLVDDDLYGNVTPEQLADIFAKYE
ncbi:MAG TPA: NAD(P)H-dependent oxidoreductase subunit E [Anaerolineales bacterium]